MQPPLQDAVLIGRVLWVGLSALCMHFQVVMCGSGVLLCSFAAAAQEDACVSGLGRAQGGEEVRLGTADVPVAGVMARQGLVRGGMAGVMPLMAGVMPVVLAFVGQVRADVGMALMCAVGAVSV